MSEPATPSHEPRQPDGMSHSPFDDGPEPVFYAQEPALVQPKSKAKRVSLITGAVLGGLLVLGGGAYAGTNMMNQMGDKDIAQAVPQKTAIFAEVDLNPSNGQKTAALSLAAKMDRLIDKDDEYDAENKSIKELITDPVFEDLDYETEVEPWIGDKVAIAGWGDFSEGLPDSSYPYTNAGYDIDPYDDYYDDAYLNGEYDEFDEFDGELVSNIQAMPLPEQDKDSGPSLVIVYEVKDTVKADEAANKVVGLKGGPEAYTVYGDYLVFAENDEVISDYVDKIEQGNLAVNETYVSDMKELGGDNIATGWMDVSTMGLNDYMSSMTNNESSQDEIKGRIATGISLDKDAVISNTKVIGMEQGEVSQEMYADIPVGLTDMENLSADTQVAFSTRGLPTVLDAVYTEAQKSDPTTAEQIKSVFNEMGIEVPGGFEKLFGTETGVGFSIGENYENARFEVRALGADGATVSDAVSSAGADDAVQVESTGDTVVVTYSDNDTQASGKLGDNELFKKAVSNLDETQSAGYIDMDSLSVAMGENNDNGESYGAIGVTASHDKDKNITNVSAKWVF